MSPVLRSLLRGAILLPLVGCGGPTEPGAIPGLYRRAVALSTATGTPGLSAVIADTSGTMIGVFETAGQVQRIVLRSRAGGLARVQLGADGRPTSALFGGLLVRYSNWTATSVDVAVTDGTPGAPVLLSKSLELPEELAALAALPPAGAAAVSGQLSTVLNSAGLGLALGACVAGMLATPVTFGAATAVVAVTCGTTIAKTVNFFVGVEDDPLVLAGDGFGTLSDVLGCASREPVACAGSVVTLLTSAATSLEQLQSSLAASEVRLADALRNNYGVQPSPLYLSAGRSAQARAMSTQGPLVVTRWASQNLAIATVTSNGSVTGVSKGTTTLVAYVGALGIVGKVVVEQAVAGDPGDITGSWRLQMFSNVAVGGEFVFGNLCSRSQATGRTLLTDGVLKLTSTGATTAVYSLRIRYTYVASGNGTTGQVYADTASGSVTVIPPVPGLGPPDGTYWHLVSGPASQGTVRRCNGQSVATAQFILAPYYRTPRGLETQGFASGDVWVR